MRPRINNSHPPPRTYELHSSDMMVVMMMMLMIWECRIIARLDFDANVSIACGMCGLLVECVYCLWNVSIACGMFPLNFCLPSSLSLRLRADACGMCGLLVECVYCLWNVRVACGMCLLLVECIYCLWNVSVELAAICMKGYRTPETICID